METADGRRRALTGFALIAAVVLLMRLPFLGQPVQGDDVYYLAAAEHAQVEPLHPKNFKLVFLGDVVDFRGQSHGPLNDWVLAGLLAAFGDIYEVPYHAAYIAFSLIAAAAMWWLARRFSPHPLWATLLFLAVPAFVVNGNSFEADVPFLAFWMAGIALFCGRRLWWAAAAMALASLAAYQAVFLTPILMLYTWLYRRRDRASWVVTMSAPVAIAAWQVFERYSTGALPASVLTGYFHTYGFQAFARKLQSAAALAVHACFLVFPALLPPAVVVAWRKRDRDTVWLAGWIGIFFAGAVAVFFAGSARYLLPMAAPVALLASRLRPRWLAVAFGLQMALSLALAVVNYQQSAAYRDFAASLDGEAANRRVWINGDWGLRYYLEAEGGLELQRGQVLYPGDVVVTSELSYPMEVTDPVAALAKREVRPSLPLRLIGLDTRSGYSTSDRGLLPFGISTGPVDRVRADLVVERKPVLEYVPMTAGEQIVSGLWALEGGSWRWMSRSGTVLVKSPAAPRKLTVAFTIPDMSPARRIELKLDGRTVAERVYDGPGSYTLESEPVMPAGASAAVTAVADRTFTAPGDRRELSIIVTGVGFR